MKAFLRDFARRGLIACGIGPMVLAAVYLVLHHRGLVDTLSVQQVVLGIVSLTLLAFVAAGMNALYQLERLRLMPAILIHGGVLYLGYLAAYLINGWLEWGSAPVLVFSGIFAAGYLLIWAVIYCIVRRNTQKVNRLLKEKQHASK